MTELANVEHAMYTALPSCESLHRPHSEHGKRAKETMTPQRSYNR